MKPEEVCNPTPGQMTAALLKATQARRWNHWQHEVETHAGDWVETGAMRKPQPTESDIIHCMRSRRGKRYVERWGEQEKLFIPVRW